MDPIIGSTSIVNKSMKKIHPTQNSKKLTRTKVLSKELMPVLLLRCLLGCRSWVCDRIKGYLGGSSQRVSG